MLISVNAAKSTFLFVVSLTASLILFFKLDTSDCISVSKSNSPSITSALFPIPAIKATACREAGRFLTFVYNSAFLNSVQRFKISFLAFSISRSIQSCGGLLFAKLTIPAISARLELNVEIRAANASILKLPDTPLIFLARSRNFSKWREEHPAHLSATKQCWSLLPDKY